MAGQRKRTRTQEVALSFAPTAAEAAPVAPSQSRCHQMIEDAIAELEQTIRSKREAREKVGHLLHKLEKLAGSL